MWPFSKKTAPATELQTPKLSLEPPPPLPSAAPRRGVIAAHMPRGEGTVMHPGWGLTAERIRLAFLLAEQGAPQMQCDVFDDVIERDGHTRSLIDGRIEAVAGKQWIIQAGGETPADAEVARQLELAVRRITDVASTWEHQLTANFYGYAATEIDWDRVDGQTVPVHFANVPHRRFKFVVGTDEPRLLTDENLIDGEPLQPGKWMFSRRRHRSIVRAGEMRTVTWWAWLKALSVRDWQIFCSRFGLPFVLGFYSENTPEEERKKLKEAILAFGTNGGAALLDQTKVEVKEPASIAAGGGGASVHPGLVTLCNQEISKIISGATLTSGEGTSVGSYALGKVHQDRSFDLTLGDAERLAGWFQASIGEPFVRFNGLQARAPRLKMRVVREQDPLTRMQIQSIFANELGGELDEDQVREEFDFKVPTGKALKGTKKPEKPAGPGAPKP